MGQALKMTAQAGWHRLKYGMEWGLAAIIAYILLHYLDDTLTGNNLLPLREQIFS